LSLYLDTSALVSLYYPESCSERVAALVAGLPLPFSALHELEINNALELKLFRKECSAEAVRGTLAAIEEDLRSGTLVRPAIDWPDTFRAAVDIAQGHSRHVGSRSLDVLHVAVAQTIEAERFASTDERQNALAKQVGLELAVV
jgi:predicted nucleic acid-binding protein